MEKNRLKDNLERFVPFVMDKSLMKKRFEPMIIQESLKKEAGLEHIEAYYITKKTVAFLVSIGGNKGYNDDTKGIQTITSPMIREIVNSILLQNGYEKARLRNTRIGFPYYDLKRLIEMEEETGEDMSEEILIHIRKEFKNVKDLIEITENGKKYAGND